MCKLKILPEFGSNENDGEPLEVAEKRGQDFPFDDVITFRQSSAHHVNHQRFVILERINKLERKKEYTN